MPRALFQIENVGKSGFGRNVGVALDEARLVIFDLSHHFRLTFDGLRAENKGNAALARKRYRKAIARDRLHYCRSQRNVDLEFGGFALFELDERRF